MPLAVCEGFSGLEEELFRRIDAAQAADRSAPIAVVVPTSRILSRLRRIILESGRTYLGLHLLHHLAFAERILESEPGPPPRVVGSEVLLPLLQAVLEARSDPGPLTRFAMRYAGARITLLGTLRDLRDAHVDPSAFRRSLPGSDSVRELGEIFAAYQGALENLAASGLVDSSGLVTRAIEIAPGSSFLVSLKGLFHFGAYDLIQIHQDLLAAAARRVPVTLLVPGIGAGPAFGYAQRFLQGRLAAALGPPKEIDLPNGGLLADRLRHLYDEGSDPGPSPRAGKIEVVTAAGERLELEAVARRILKIHHEGVPLHQVGVVARTLEPYAPHLESVFETFSLPFVTSVSQPLLRYPGPLAFRKLLRILDDDFPRAGTIELLRSAAFRPEPAIGTSEPGRPDHWDLWSRQAGIRGGREEWVERLPAWARRRETDLDRRAGADDDEDPEDPDRRRRWSRWQTRECDRLAGLIESLSEEALRWSRQAGWNQHAGFLRALAGKWLQGFGGGPGGLEREVERILDGLALQEIGEKAGGRGESGPTRARVRQRMETLLAEASFRESSPADEGVAILDAMQARGSSFRVLFLIGLTSDQWPRRIHPDPFLSDPDRRRLAESLGLQVPVKETAREEDRLLLALLLGSARERLILSYQRADDAGRARAHSSVWREIARIVRGRAESAALLEEGDAVRVLPTDPARRAGFELRTEEGGSGILTGPEAVILSAATAPDPVEGLLERMKSLGGVSPAVRSGAETIRALNRWSGGDLKRDGAIGEILPARRFLSASRIETMGQCPSRFWFRYGIQLEELEEPEGEEWIDPGLVGTVTHSTLEKIYRRLIEAERFPIRDLEAVIRLAGETLDRIGAEELAPLRDTPAGRFPILWSIFERQWDRSLRSFLRFDLGRLREENATPIEVEHEIRTEVALPGRRASRPVGLRGVIDRIDRLADGSLRIADYKTSRSLEDRVHPNQLLKGNQLQMGVYVFLAAAGFPDRSIGAARILGVGPRNPDPAADPKKSAPEIEVPGDLGDDPVWQGIGDTIATLVEMIRDGRFPIRPDHRCQWCAYRSACRRNHPPTLDRIREAGIFRDYHRLSERSRKKPFGAGEDR